MLGGKTICGQGLTILWRGRRQTKSGTKESGLDATFSIFFPGIFSPLVLSGLIVHLGVSYWRKCNLHRSQPLTTTQRLYG